MRPCILSRLRSSRPLRLEIVEDRCLLSGSALVPTLPLLAPASLASSTSLALVRTQVAEPVITPAGVAGLTGSAVSNSAGKSSSASVLNPARILPTEVRDSPRPANTSPWTVVNPVGNIASFFVSSSERLTTPLAHSLSKALEVTSTIGVTGSVGTQLSGPAIVVNLLSVRAAVDLELNDLTVTGGLSGGSSPNGAVMLDAEAAEPSAIGVDLRIGQAGSPELPLQEKAAGNLGGSKLTLTVGANSGSTGTQSPPSGDVYRGGEFSTGRGGGGEAFNVQGTVGSGRSGGLVPNPSGFATNVSAPGAATTSATATPFGVDGGLESIVVHPLPDSDAAAETVPESTQLVAFLPVQVNSTGTLLHDVLGGAETVKPDNSEPPPVAPRTAVLQGASEPKEDGLLAPPQSNGQPADWLPVNLAALEGEIQTFFEQVEQLGVGLGSLLGRMNLSPWFTTIAVAAVAGEMARRHMQRPPPRPLLTACEDATGAWFPGLAGPWSLENP